MGYRPPEGFKQLKHYLHLFYLGFKKNKNSKIPPTYCLVGELWDERDGHLHAGLMISSSFLAPVVAGQVPKLAGGHGVGPSPPNGIHSSGSSGSCCILTENWAGPSGSGRTGCKHRAGAGRAMPQPMSDPWHFACSPGCHCWLCPSTETGAAVCQRLLQCL